jgi:hypothetical protein
LLLVLFLVLCDFTALLSGVTLIAASLMDRTAWGCWRPFLILVAFVTLITSVLSMGAMVGWSAFLEIIAPVASSIPGAFLGAIKLCCLLIPLLIPIAMAVFLIVDKIRSFGAGPYYYYPSSVGSTASTLGRQNRCSNCGATLTETDFFCSECGRPVREGYRRAQERERVIANRSLQRRAETPAPEVETPPPARRATSRSEPLWPPPRSREPEVREPFLVRIINWIDQLGVPQPPSVYDFSSREAYHKAYAEYREDFDRWADYHMTHAIRDGMFED